jgi:hypothetical protein
MAQPAIERDSPRATMEGFTSNRLLYVNAFSKAFRVLREKLIANKEPEATFYFVIDFTIRTGTLTNFLIPEAVDLCSPSRTEVFRPQWPAHRIEIYGPPQCLSVYHRQELKVPSGMPDLLVGLEYAIDDDIWLVHMPMHPGKQSH